MKAVQIKSFGGPEVLEINEISIPTPKENQVLVEVYTASVNPFDVKFVSGAYGPNPDIKFPFTIGGDFSGIIKDTEEPAESDTLRSSLQRQREHLLQQPFQLPMLILLKNLEPIKLLIIKKEDFESQTKGPQGKIVLKIKNS